MLKKTKIICTQGPGVVDALIENGMNLARFNFSHGDHAEHLRRINMVREAAKKAGKVISLVLDTKGPEMRLGEFKDGSVMLEKGKQFTLTYDDTPGDETHVSVNHKGLYTEVKPGDTLLLSDGLVALKVDEIRGKDIITTIQNDGKMSTKKRVFGCEQDMDFVAASFIQRPEDVLAIRKLIEEHNGHMEIVPKIENLEGVKNFDDILEVSDGIMVARGDLGVEVPAEDVPLIQKEIIKKCNKAGKPVIVATQMLESMTTNPRPTRAEVSDVGNAILDGTDAIMLSGETASGDYPVEAVSTMNRIAQRIESSLEYKELFVERGIEHLQSRTRAVAHATVQMAWELDVPAIITPTVSGYTTKVVSRYRPKATIVAYTPDAKVVRQLNLRWGVYPVLGTQWKDVDEMINNAVSAAVKQGTLKRGDTTIITSGIKLQSKTSVGNNTNMIRVYQI